MSRYSQFTDDELRQQAAANSAAWHGADPSTQTALHDANVEIHEELDRRSGNTSTFDSVSGTWSESSQEEDGGAGDPGNGAAAWTNGGYDDNGNVDYSVRLRNLMNAGSADAHTLQALLDARQNKAQGTRYYNDSFAREVQSYINDLGGERQSQAQAQQAQAQQQAQQAQAQEQARQEQVKQEQARQEELLRQQQAAQLAQALDKLKYAYDENLREYQAGESDLERLYRENVAEYENRRDKLRAAYEKNLAGYQDSRNRLGQTYDAARNRTAAQSAQDQRAFDERAAAMGLGTGAAGQAALARQSTLQTALAGLDQSQANAQADIDLRVQNLGTELSQQESDLDLQLAKVAAQYGLSQSALKRAIQDLTARYELARAEAQNSNQAQTAQALYEELLRQQQSDRADRLQAQEWEREDRLRQEQWARQDAQQAQEDAKSRIQAYLQAGGQADQLDPVLISQSGYSDAELSALEAYYLAKTAAADAAPATILDTMRSLGSDAAAYAYLVSKGYNKDATATLWQYYKNGQSSAAGTNPNALVSDSRTPAKSYDNGSLTPEQVRQMQRYYGLTEDGYWGPNSRATTGMTANEAWKAMLSRNAEADFDR